MSKKTSKTAHVLNLLSPTIEEEIIGDTVDTEGLSENRSSMQNTVNTPENAESIQDILHISSSNDDLSLLIRRNLEKEFLKDSQNNKEHNDSEDIDDMGDMGDMDSNKNASISGVSEEQEDSEKITHTEKIDTIDNTTDNTMTQEQELPDNIADILANANMVRSVENALIEETLGKDTKKNQNFFSDASEEKNNNVHDANEKIENAPFYYTNIFEHIVKDCALDYINRFDVCSCERCIADVTALALTNLPPKYVVTDYENVAPLIHFLEHKHEVIIMTEMTKACLTVHAEPRHKIKKA